MALHGPFAAAALKAVRRHQSAVRPPEAVAPQFAQNDFSGAIGIHDLLAQQLVVVEQAIDLNRAIAQRLTVREVGTDNAPFCSISPQHGPTMASGSASVCESVKGSESGLTAPLLPHASKDAWATPGNSPPPPGPPCTSILEWSPTEPHHEDVAVHCQTVEGHHRRSSIAGAQARRSLRITNLFPSVESIKALIMRAMGQNDETQNIVCEENSCWQKLSKTAWFNHLSLCAILLNTIWVAIDTDLNQAAVLCQAPMPFQIVENAFCVFFVFEILVRVLAFRSKWDCLKDRWLMFDCVVVASMVWLDWVLVVLFLFFGDKSEGSQNSFFRTIRLFRLLRVARAVMIVGNVPELMILAEGIVLAVRSVAAVLVFMALVIYIFSIIFTELLRDTPVAKGNFEHVPQSINTLLLQVVCGFDSGLLSKLQASSIGCYLLFLVYFLTASLTLMNMLVGAICDVVATVSSDEKEAQFATEVERLVSELMRDLDVDGSHTLSKEEFDGIIYNQEMMTTLMNFGVDVIGVVDFGSYLFTETSELSFADFMQLVSQFRESKGATMRDVMNLRKYLAREITFIDSRMNKLDDAESGTQAKAATKDTKSPLMPCSGASLQSGSSQDLRRGRSESA